MLEVKLQTKLHELCFIGRLQHRVCIIGKLLRKINDFINTFNRPDDSDDQVSPIVNIFIQ